MSWIILSIFCSVSVGVLLKFAKRYNVSLVQAITFNYLAAISFSYFFFEPTLTINSSTPIPLYIGLGVLLPTIFLCLALSVKHYGIVKTDIAQRLSLFIPLIAAWLIFKEDISTLKFIGLGLGLLAVFLIMNRKDQHQGEKNYIFPILVFVGFGVIDVLFKQVAKFVEVPYTTSLFFIFIIAFLISILYLIYLVVTKKEKLTLINFICGLILGFFNFGNILFYLKAHKHFSTNPSTVFASMNLGVIILGSLIGVFLFKEKLNQRNYVGIILAIISILLITAAQLYAF